MGAYNALEGLPPRPSTRPAGRLTGPALLRPWLEPVPDPPPPAPERRGTGRAPRRPAGRNALDDLLPGPGQDPDDDGGYDPAAGPAPARPWLEPVPDLPEPPPPRRGRRVLGRNALDDLLPGPGGGLSGLMGAAGPGEDGPKARVTLRLPADLLEAVRDAAAHLAGPPTYLTIATLAERALRAELDRLSAAHHGGRPFPPRPGSPAARR
jgi:hypothetical protein